MKNKKLIKEDIESIKFMMNYDTRKTLTENREILNEQQYPPFPIKLNPGPFGHNVASAIGAAAVGTVGTNVVKIYEEIQKIKDVQNYYNINSLISKYTGGQYKDIANLINGEFEGDNLRYVSKIAYHLKQIPGLSATYSLNAQNSSHPDASFKSGSFSITGFPTDPRLKTAQPAKTDTASNTGSTKTDSAAKTDTAPIIGGGGAQIPIPPQLKDSAGVKKFQEWVIGIKGDKTILGGTAADGKFGGRTSKAWTTYGNEYLNPKLETLKPLEVKPITPAAGTAQTTDGSTTQPELQLPNNQLQQAPQTNQNMTGRQKRQFNRFVNKQERMKKRNQNQNQTQTNAIDSAVPQTNTNQPGSTNA